MNDSTPQRQESKKTLDASPLAYQHIFLMSHMRANTSLISHVLGSHPQISGYYEMHLSYLGNDDLRKQEQQLFANEESIKNSSDYLFDKILHNKYKLALDKLTSHPIKVLVSIRPPEQSIKSIINLFRKKNNHHPYAETEKAIEYYLHRLGELNKFCEQNKNNYYYYDADLIRTKPEKSLTKIQKWLSLQTPLSEEYQVFSLTGQTRVGDSSHNMKRGKIIRQQTNYDDINIPSDLLNHIKIESERYRQQMINHAIDSMVIDKN